MTTNKYQQAIAVITKEQEKIIGKNLARQLVLGVSNIKFDKNDNLVLSDKANPKKVLSDLVDQYATMFGRASIEVAKEAVQNSGETFAPNELPDNLQ